MDFHNVDSYLLTGSPQKSAVIGELLAHRVDVPGASPYYRALEAIGARAADEALIALRLVTGRKAPDDDSVRRVRALAALSRAIEKGDVGAAAAALKKDGASVADVVAKAPADADALAALRDSVRAAYQRMVE